jgi:hypothetical protein
MIIKGLSEGMASFFITHKLTPNPLSASQRWGVIHCILVASPSLQSGYSLYTLKEHYHQIILLQSSDLLIFMLLQFKMICGWGKEITFGELVPINQDSVPHFVRNDRVLIRYVVEEVAIRKV